MADSVGVVEQRAVQCISFTAGYKMFWCILFVVHYNTIIIDYS